MRLWCKEKWPRPVYFLKRLFFMRLSHEEMVCKLTAKIWLWYSQLWRNVTKNIVNSQLLPTVYVITNYHYPLPSRNLDKLLFLSHYLILLLVFSNSHSKQFCIFLWLICRWTKRPNLMIPNSDQNWWFLIYYEESTL